MMAAPQLPDVLYVQDDGRELVVNRTAVGAMNRNLGYWRRPGESVGIYKLERMVSLQPAAAAAEIVPIDAPTANPQT